MKAILLFLSLLFSADNSMYIVLDDSIESKIIKSEMDRNWFKGAKEPYSDILQQVAEKQCNLQSSAIIIDRYDFKSCEKYRIERFIKYPQYRIGDYKDFKEFDPRTFRASGTAILTIYALKNNFEADEKEWEMACNKLKIEARYNHINDIVIWGQTNSISDINDVYFFEDGINGAPFDEIVQKYSLHKGFPKYKQPKLPENPIIKFPWEP